MISWTFVFEMIGTVAFAIAGAIVGMKNKTDLFGVLALGIVTATGGGVIRDLILGVHPPMAFVNPVYVLVASITSLIMFIVAAYQQNKDTTFGFHRYREMLFIMDSVGLGIFTTVGVLSAVRIYGSSNGFLCVFCGLMTGVGGGLLRDTMVDRLPDIFRKHIYAVASIVGAEVCVLCCRFELQGIGVWCGAGVVFLIRFLAAHFLWSLPKITNFKEEENV